MFLIFVEGHSVRRNRLKGIVDVFFGEIGGEDTQILALKADERLDEPHRITRALGVGGETFVQTIDDDVRRALRGP